MMGEELPWPQVEAAAAEKIARHTREGKVRMRRREGGMEGGREGGTLLPVAPNHEAKTEGPRR